MAGLDSVINKKECIKNALLAEREGYEPTPQYP